MLRPAKLFFSYSHKDEKLRDELAAHLAVLEHAGVLQDWHDRRVGAGQDWRAMIDQNLEEAHILLLLVSSDFLASDYCYHVEMRRALSRHDRGQALVVPVILRPCNWRRAPFADLQALPREAMPVTTWSNRDEAWTDVATGIEAAATRLSRAKGPDEKADQPEATPTTARDRSLWIATLRRVHQHLVATSTAKRAQKRRRDALIAAVCARRRLKEPLRHEDFFARYHRALTDEEKLQFRRIRAMTEGLLYDQNRALFDLLDGSPDLATSVPSLEKQLTELREHLRFWLNEYRLVFCTTPEMCVLYAGSDNGVPFPQGVDAAIARWLKEQSEEG